jgi:putative ABC transport system ATP-binding protein
MSLIRTKKLTKVYQNAAESDLIVLNQVDLTIENREWVALTGPSGAGKTTLMHVLGCLDLPTSGHYFLDGQDVSSFSRKELAHIRNKQMGFVFQNFHLLNDLNALENVMLPQLYGGIREIQARHRSQELLELVGLNQRSSYYPNQLSGGQKQRVAIARALAMEPKIVLADEPTGNLDSENTKIILELFAMINQIKQTTLIMVTHEKAIAAQAQRCITVRDGQIASDLKVGNEHL